MKKNIYNSIIFPAFIILLLSGTSLTQTIQWQETNLVEGNPIFYLQSNSSGDIFASRVGDFIGTIYRTTDMGETWTLQTNGLAQGWRHLLAVNSNDVIFAAGEMEISYSSDNGETWLPTAPILVEPVALGIDYNDDIYFSGNIIEGGDIYKSTDDGNSWVLINNGLENYWVTDIAFSPEGYVLVTAFETQPNNNSKVFYSSNQGASWIPFNMNFTPFPEDIVVNTNGYIFISAYVHSIYRSTDFGDTWELVNDYIHNIVELHTNQSGHLFISSYEHGIYRSTDNGENWIQVNSGLPYLITGALCVDPNGFLYTGLSGLPGKVYRTTDSSVPVELISFSADVNNNTISLNWMTATETNNLGFEVQRKELRRERKESFWKDVGYIAGSGTTTDPTSYSFTDCKVPSGTYSYRLKQIDYDGSFEYSNIIEVTVSLPTEFSLSQNFPNPFNPETKIKFSLPSSAEIIIKVYDILGKEIKILINEYKQAGTYEVEFNASNLPSGVYFYKMISRSYSETKKMILLR